MNSIIGKLSMSVVAVAALSTSVLAVEGTVDAGGTLRLREEANTLSTILDNIPNGVVVSVTGVTEDGWYQVAYEDQTGFVSGEFLAVAADDVDTLPIILEPVYGHVIAGPLNVRDGAGTDFTPVNILNVGSVLEVIGEEDGWYVTADGFVSSDYVEVVSKEEAMELKEAAAKAKQAAEVSTSATNSSLQAQVVAYAKSFLGSRYVYGGTTPAGFDCSGFVGYVYKNFGITLNRTSRDMYSNGVAVAKTDLQPGDILFFSSSGSTINHVGMYIGNRQFIHASTPATGVLIDSIDASYYSRTYVGARRVL